MESFQSINPFNQELMGEYPTLSSEELSEPLQHMQNAFEDWRQVSREKRLDFLPVLAQLLRAETQECARLISIEMGKPMAQAIVEIEKCAGLCDYYFEHALGLFAANESDQYRHFPLGVILGIMPWNFPFWQAFRFAIPTLLAGNAVVLKHAPNVPQCTQKIQSLIHQAIPSNAPFIAPFLSLDATQAAIRHPLVQGVSLTGSNRAGRAVAQAAGDACIPCVLELGGSDPFIVCEDADIAAAAKTAATARCSNAGQVCIAAKRLILAESIQEPFLQAFEAHCQAYVSGDPIDEGTTLGPLCRADIKTAIDDQLNKSLAMGATIRFQCQEQRRDGNFFPVTCVENVSSDMPVVAEETFGPVVSVQSVSSDEQALQLANQTQFGLGASVWTSNKARADWFYAGLEAGAVAINTQVRSDFAVPFGGTKQSGFGRELAGAGLMAFTNGKARLT